MSIYHLDRPLDFPEDFMELAGIDRPHAEEYWWEVPGICSRCLGPADDPRHWAPYQIQKLLDASVAMQVDLELSCS